MIVMMMLFADRHCRCLCESRINKFCEFRLNDLVFFPSFFFNHSYSFGSMSMFVVDKSQPGLVWRVGVCVHKLNLSDVS